MTETTTTTIPALLPCPFCDGKAEVHEEDGHNRYAAYWVGCNGCGCATDTDLRAEEAIAAWNRRAAPASPSAAQGWMPIETAPMDGTPVLIWGATICVPGEMVVGIRSDEHDDLELWDIHDGKHGPHRLRGPSPTHWMPLPAAPGAQPAQPDAEERGLREAAAAVVHEYDHPATGDGDLFGKIQAMRSALSAARASAPAAPQVVGILRDMTALFEMTDEAQQPGTDSYTVLWRAREFLRSAGEGK